jgi:hypothetical protein
VNGPEDGVWPWVEPPAVAAGLKDRDGLVCLLSDGGPAGRFSYVTADPERTFAGPLDPDGLSEALVVPAGCHGIGLVAYDWGARPATGVREPVWPDLMTAVYRTVLVFDHARRTVSVVGDAATAAIWLDGALAPNMRRRASDRMKTTAIIAPPSPMWLAGSVRETCFRPISPGAGPGR